MLAGTPLVVLLVGVTVILVILLRPAMRAIGAPALVGYILLGLLLELLNRKWEIVSGNAEAVYEFLASIGVIFLLFRVGIESDLGKLRRCLGEASHIWIGNIVISAVAAWVAAYHLLELAAIPSLVVVAALTATSVGVSVGVWQEAGAMNSSNGERLIDVAEMDDISGVVMMALLFGVLPVLRAGGGEDWLPLAARTSGIVALKMAGFAALCFTIARYERRITGLIASLPASSHPMLLVVGIGLVVAALSGLLGLSVAIGAFFAGLVFSSDPRSEKIDAALDSLYDLFTPFFFIGVGMKISPESLSDALVPAIVLTVAAAGGKFAGAALPALLTGSRRDAVLLGVSLIPRAEIAMIIMQRGLQLGDWAVPPRVFSAMVMVSAITSVGAPLVIQSLLRRWPQSEGAAA